jgi:hypothetical protein
VQIRCHLLAGSTLLAHLIEHRAWNPTPNAPVNALVAGAEALYVGGAFTNIAGVSRAHAASFSLGAQEVAPWSPAFDKSITSLELSGDNLYAAGIFRSVNGIQRTNLAAVDHLTGQTSTWNPRPTGFASGNPLVTDIVVSGGLLYVTGYFNGMGGQPRNGIASVDLETGQSSSWAPHVKIYYGSCVAVGTEAVYVGAYVLGGFTGHEVLAIDNLTGKLLPWSSGGNYPIYRLLMNGATLYCGTDFQAAASGRLTSRGISAVLAEPEVALGKPRISNDEFVTDVPAAPGFWLVVEASEDLANWRSVSTNIAAGAPFQYTDPQVGTVGNRFFRTKSP